VLRFNWILAFDKLFKKLLESKLIICVQIWPNAKGKILIPKAFNLISQRDDSWFNSNAWWSRWSFLRWWGAMKNFRNFISMSRTFGKCILYWRSMMLMTWFIISTRIIIFYRRVLEKTVGKLDSSHFWFWGLRDGRWWSQIKHGCIVFFFWFIILLKHAQLLVTMIKQRLIEFIVEMCLWSLI
jgi:hypothetical protein